MGSLGLLFYCVFIWPTSVDSWIELFFIPIRCAYVLSLLIINFFWGINLSHWQDLNLENSKFKCKLWDCFRCDLCLRHHTDTRGIFSISFIISEEVYGSEFWLFFFSSAIRDSHAYRHNGGQILVLPWAPRYHIDAIYLIASGYP